MLPVKNRHLLFGQRDGGLGGIGSRKGRQSDADFRA